jgi:hypothetical protein
MSSLDAQLGSLGDDGMLVSLDAKKKDSVVHVGKQITALQLTRKHVGVRKLNIGRNRLTSLKSIRRLPALTMLAAPHNALTASGITPLLSLRTLVSLNLSHNKLEALPREPFVCGALASLQALVLGHNALRDVSVLALCPMPSLTTLVLSNNALGAAGVPADAVDADAEHHDAAAAAARCGGLDANLLRGMPLLERLNLSHNQLLEAPPFWEAPGLTQLRLVGNRLSAVPRLPASTQPCFELRILDVGHNKIAGEWGAAALLVAAIAPSVQQLGMRGNQLVGAPTEKKDYAASARTYCAVLPSLKALDNIIVNERHVERVKRRRAFGDMVKSEAKRVRADGGGGAAAAAAPGAHSRRSATTTKSVKSVKSGKSGKSRAGSSRTAAPSNKASVLEEAAALLAAAARSRIAARTRVDTSSVKADADDGVKSKKKKKKKKKKKEKKKEKDETTKATMTQTKTKTKKKKKKKKTRGDGDGADDEAIGDAAFSSVSGVLAVSVVERAAATPAAGAAAEQPRGPLALKKWLAKSAAAAPSAWD